MFDTGEAGFFVIQPADVHAALDLFAGGDIAGDHLSPRHLRQPGIIVITQKRRRKRAAATATKGSNQLIALLLRERGGKQDNAVAAARLLLNQAFQNPRHIGIVGMDLIGQEHFIVESQQPQVVMFKGHDCHQRLIKRAHPHLGQKRFFIAVGKPCRAALAEWLFVIGLFRTGDSAGPDTLIKALHQPASAVR